MTYTDWKDIPEKAMIALAFLKVDMAGSTSASEETKARFRRLVEEVARGFDGAVSTWVGDGTTIFFRAQKDKNAEEIAVLAARQILERLMFSAGMSAHLAISSGIQPYQKNHSVFHADALNHCGHLLPITSDAILLEGAAFTVLPPALQAEFRYAGTTVRDRVRTYVFPKSKELNPTHFLPPHEDVGKMEMEYLKRLYDRYSTLSFRGLREQAVVPKIDLLEIFEPLRVRKVADTAGRASFPPDLLREEEWRGKRHPAKKWVEREPAYWQADPPLDEMELHAIPAQREEPAQSFLDAFARGKRFVLLGPPGSGKSTLLKWLAVTLCKGHYSAWERLGRADELFPILVSISFLYRMGMTASTRSAQAVVPPLSPLEALAEVYRVEGLGNISALLEEKLKKGKARVLMDALDELLTPRDRANAGKIHRVAHEGLSGEHIRHHVTDCRV